MSDNDKFKSLEQFQKSEITTNLDAKIYLAEVEIKERYKFKGITMSEKYKNKNLTIAGIVAVLFAAIGAYMLKIGPVENSGSSNFNLFGILEVSTNSLAVSLLAVAALIMIYALNRMFR